MTLRPAPNAEGCQRPLSHQSNRMQEAFVLFTALEQQVITIGFSEGEPPVILVDRPSKWLDNLRTLIFGHRSAKPLADCRLEALRAMAAAIRVAPTDPDEGIVTAFVEAGWDLGCVGCMQRMAFARWPDAHDKTRGWAWRHLFRSGSSSRRKRGSSSPHRPLHGYANSASIDAFISSGPDATANPVCRTALSRAA